MDVISSRPTHLSTLPRAYAGVVEGPEPEVASPDIHLISHLDATEPIIEPMATQGIQQLEELKRIGGSHVTADVCIERQTMAPNKKIARGLLTTGMMLAPTVAGLAVGIATGSVLVGAAALYAGWRVTKHLAQAGMLQKGLGSIFSAIKEKKMAEPMWDGRRTYRIQADATPAIDSPVITSSALPAVRDPRDITSFLASNMKAYPSGTTIVHMMGHGLGYRYAAGLPFPAFQQVLADTTAQAGRKPDLLLMESCLEGNLEALAAAQPYSRYAVVSEETVSAGVVGEMLKATLQDSAGVPVTPRELGRALIAHSARDLQNPLVQPGAETLSLIDMEKVPDLVQAVDRFGSLLAAEAREGRGHELKVAVQGTPAYPQPGIFKQMREKLAIGDLRSFAERVEKIYGGGEIESTSRFGPIKWTRSEKFPEAVASPRSQAIQEACARVLGALGQAVVARHTSQDYQGAGGISIQMPSRTLAKMDQSLARQGMGTFQGSAAPQGWKDFVAEMGRQM